MARFRQILKTLFFLPPLPTVLIAAFGYAFVLLVFLWEIEIPAVQYLSYTCSAYALIITVTGYPHFSAFVTAVKRYIREHPLIKKLQDTAFGARFFYDVRFRSDVLLYQGLLINLLYIGMKVFSGIYYRSVWFMALACYYFLLAMMRLMLLRRKKGRPGRTPREIELRRCKLCGIVMLQQLIVVCHRFRNLALRQCKIQILIDIRYTDTNRTGCAMPAIHTVSFQMEFLNL